MLSKKSKIFIICFLCVFSAIGAYAETQESEKKEGQGLVANVLQQKTEAVEGIKKQLGDVDLPPKKWTPILSYFI